MTYYERIQQAIDYIEEYLLADITAEEAARCAFLSIAHFYRLFPEFTGYSYKEYVRKRRLAESLRPVAFFRENICDIALNSGFGTLESFARAFRREFGLNPSDIRKSAEKSGTVDIRGLEPIALVTEFYDDVVIKYLDETCVICNRAVSDCPERDAWRPLERWARAEQRLKKPYRIFGLEDPPPPKLKRTDENGFVFYTPVPGVAYGYEFRLTVDKEVRPSRGLVKKVIPAGRYAVMSADSAEYTAEWKGRAWAKMLRTLETTDYRVRHYDDGPRLFEEHVQHFPKDDIIRLDLYIELE